jgi:hypothetical protein
MSRPIEEAPTADGGLPGLGRRAFLQGAGVVAGLALGGGLGLLGRRPTGDFRTTALALWDSLSPLQREAVARPWDHPSRQMVGHVACLGAPRVSYTLTAGQQTLVHRLYETMTSASRRRRFGPLIGLEGGGLDPCEIALYGDPHTDRFQVALSGGHLLLRGGGLTPEGSAFGGPLGYGHQLGDGVPRLPGNTFAYHGDAANAVIASLDANERARAIVGTAPPFETAVQLQGESGEFTGLSVGALPDARKSAISDLVDIVLSGYDETDLEAARGCIRRNGGLDALTLSVYASGGYYDDGQAWVDLDGAARTRRGEPYWHVWRLEGPGTVLHFRGWPHVHAAVHLADDGGAGQYVGEVLAEATELWQGEQLRGLLLDALRTEGHTAVAFLPGEPHARFPAGPVTSGLAWSLDPYADELAVASVRGAGAAAPFREQAAAQGVALEPDQLYRVATTGFASGREELLGAVEDLELPGRGLRFLYEDYLREYGLRRA